MENEPLPAATVDKSHIGPCPQADCGRTFDEMGPAAYDRTGWIVALVIGSSELPRAYCGSPCANRGIARMHRLTIRPTEAE
jgi:hypothetical protein